MSLTFNLFSCSEELDELHYQDTDSEVLEQRDSKCKVKWTHEEVSGPGTGRGLMGSRELARAPQLSWECLPDGCTVGMKRNSQ